MLTLLAALALTVSGPPAAYVDTGHAHLPLALDGWCWSSRCGAPIAPSRRTATVARGTLVRCVVGFAPSHATLTVAGRPVPASVRGDVVTWRAAAGGGFSLRVDARPGWVIYVGRLALH